jgi:hypothetical protein
MESRDRVTRIFVTVQRFENTIKRAVGVSFRRPQHKFSKLVERPLGSAQRLGAGREGDRCSAGPLLGLCWEEFQGQAAVPWNETGFWGLLKETPTAQAMRQ